MVACCHVENSWRKAESNRQEKKITQANTEFQKRPRRYEELYLNRQCKEIKDNNQIKQKKIASIKKINKNKK